MVNADRVRGHERQLSDDFADGLLVFASDNAAQAQENRSDFLVELLSKQPTLARRPRRYLSEPDLPRRRDNCLIHPHRVPATLPHEDNRGAQPSSTTVDADHNLFAHRLKPILQLFRVTKPVPRRTIERATEFFCGDLKSVELRTTNSVSIITWRGLVSAPATLSKHRFIRGLGERLHGQSDRRQGNRQQLSYRIIIEASQLDIPTNLQSLFHEMPSDEGGKTVHLTDDGIW